MLRAPGDRSRRPGAGHEFGLSATSDNRNRTEPLPRVLICERAAPGSRDATQPASRRAERDDHGMADEDLAAAIDEFQRRRQPRDGRRRFTTRSRSVCSTGRGGHAARSLARGAARVARAEYETHARVTDVQATARAACSARRCEPPAGRGPQRDVCRLGHVAADGYRLDALEPPFDAARAGSAWGHMVVASLVLGAEHR